MGWITRFQRKAVSGTGVSEQDHCSHVLLAPRWDEAVDIGHEDRASGFHCTACGRSFTPADAELLRQSKSRPLSA